MIWPPRIGVSLMDPRAESRLRFRFNVDKDCFRNWLTSFGWTTTSANSRVTSCWVRPEMIFSSLGWYAAWVRRYPHNWNSLASRMISLHPILRNNGT